MCASPASCLAIHKLPLAAHDFFFASYIHTWQLLNPYRCVMLNNMRRVISACAMRNHSLELCLCSIWLFSDGSLEKCERSTSAPSVMLWAGRQDEAEREMERRWRCASGVCVHVYAVLFVFGGSCAIKGGRISACEVRRSVAHTHDNSTGVKVLLKYWVGQAHCRRRNGAGFRFL